MTNTAKYTATAPPQKHADDLEQESGAVDAVDQEIEEQPDRQRDGRELGALDHGLVELADGGFHALAGLFGGLGNRGDGLHPEHQVDPPQQEDAQREEDDQQPGGRAVQCRGEPATSGHCWCRQADEPALAALKGRRTRNSLRGWG
ncbi:hypothetical protein FAM22021_001978 [Propionibacterium freudenreichii]|nr:hypothetical protein [Propionibacterium freudenreichii]